MNFQIASDFHIEKKTTDININNLIIPSAPYLILAGDIGSLYKFDQLKKFLEDVCKMFKDVIYVPGNHEFYTIRGIPGIPFYKLIKRLENLEESIPNLHILNRSVVRIGKYCFIGSVLWSNCPEDSEFPKYRVCIHGFNKKKYNRFNKTDISFIQNTVKMCKERNYIPIIITHYPPSEKLLNPTFTNNNFKYLYFNNLEYMLNEQDIPMWICGHTHWTFDMLSDNGTRLIANQKGIKNDSNYENDFVISLS